jgi:hypothetical protein
MLVAIKPGNIVEAGQSEFDPGDLPHITRSHLFRFQWHSPEWKRLSRFCLLRLIKLQGIPTDQHLSLLIVQTDGD